MCESANDSVKKKRKTKGAWRDMFEKTIKLLNNCDASTFRSFFIELISSHILTY